MSTFDEVMAELKRITLKDESEIIDFVRANAIGYSQLRVFYLKYGRFPLPTECEIIYNFGIASI